uniref:Recombinase family protein n=1 Tax=Streptomyces sp. NBC_00003 TaxID=2903608 RepID=A0AAU2V715_9ACTN
MTDDTLAAARRRAVELIAQGKSLDEVAATLNAEGIPVPGAWTPARIAAKIPAKTAPGPDAPQLTLGEAEAFFGSAGLAVPEDLAEHLRGEADQDRPTADA